jgi:hypothetical protein
MGAVYPGGAFWIAQLSTNTEFMRQGVTKYRHVLPEAGVVVRAVKVGRKRLWQLRPRLITVAKRTPEAIGQ